MNSMAECPNCSCCPEEKGPFDPLLRPDYADRFGPTTRDCIRLADTALRIKIEDDWSGGPGRSGNEMVFGGGKVIRESMGQSVVPRDPGKGKTDTSAGRTAVVPPDTVITGVVVLDHWGIVKTDVALRDGNIVALGKAYNPETMNPLHDGGSPTTVSARGPPTSSSDPTPKSSPARAGSLLPAGSTRTSTSSAPTRSMRRWPRVSPRSSEAAPDLRRAAPPPP